MYYNVTKCRVRVMSIPPRLSQQPNTISPKRWRFNTAGNNKTYLRLRLKCLIYLSDFNQFWISLTHFYKGTKYQISRKSVQFEQRCYMWTDGQT